MTTDAATSERAKADTTVLSVRDLRTSFNTRHGWVDIVKASRSTSPPRRRSRWSASPGSGKSVTALSVMRLLDPDASRIDGLGQARRAASS